MANIITITCPGDNCTEDVTFDNTWTRNPANIAQCTSCGWAQEVPLEAHIAPTPPDPVSGS